MTHNVKNAVEKFLDDKQGNLFDFDKEPDLRRIKSKIFQNIAQTKAVDRFIMQLWSHLDAVKKLGGGQAYTVGAVRQFCRDRKKINKAVRVKAHEKLSELKKQGDVEWLNQ